MFKYTGTDYNSDFSDFKKYAESLNLEIIFGGKFLSLGSDCSKGKAVDFCKAELKMEMSIGIGNSSNDFTLLSAVDLPFVVINENGKYCDELLAIKNIAKIDKPAPAAWKEFKNKLI